MSSPNPQLPATSYQLLATSPGFTLIEVVFTMAILAIFITGLASLDRLFGDSQVVLTLSTQSFNEASIGIEALVRELRTAKYADNGAYPLELANDQEIIFYSNIDADPQIERVRYYLTGNQLNRGITQPTGTPAQYISANEQVNLVINHIQNNTNPIFYYYNGDWPADTTHNPLPAPARLADTKLIRVALTVNPKPSRPQAQFSLESSAQIRNLKTNL